MFSLTDTFEKNDRILWRMVEDQAILIDQDEGDLVRLTPVGTAIWEALDGNRTIQQIMTHIQEEFEVDPERARREVVSFLKQLRREGLIKGVSDGM